MESGRRRAEEGEGMKDGAVKEILLPWGRIEGIERDEEIERERKRGKGQGERENRRRRLVLAWHARL